MSWSQTNDREKTVREKLGRKRETVPSYKREECVGRIKEREIYLPITSTEQWLWALPVLGKVSWCTQHIHIFHQLTHMHTHWHTFKSAHAHACAHTHTHTHTHGHAPGAIVLTRRFLGKLQKFLEFAASSQSEEGKKIFYKQPYVKLLEATWLLVMTVIFTVNFVFHNCH